MNKARIALLKQYLDADPDDPFNVYALANEYKSDDPDRAIALFEELVIKHPGYIATYYQLAHVYLELNEKEKALATLKQGISAAETSGDRLALRELKNSLDELMMEG